MLLQSQNIMKKNLDKILAEISAGELIDKITILNIKKEKITNNEKLVEIEKELKSLKNTFNEKIIPDKSLSELMEQLKKINSKLWDIEDGKRNAEKNQKFDERFIELARNVYKFNDERAKIKLKIKSPILFILS